MITDVDFPQEIRVPPLMCSSHFEPEPELIGNSSMTLQVAVPTVIVVLLLLIISTLVFGVLHRKRKLRQNRKGRSNYQVAMFSDGAQQESIVLQYNTSYHRADSIHSSRTRSMNLTAKTHTNSSLSASYVINSLGGETDSIEEPYWDPACIECDLKQELTSLNVKELSNERIE